MRRDENFVDFGKYLRCELPRYWRILQEERIRGAPKTWHHTFTGKLKNGARIKKNLSKKRLELRFKEHGLNMNEVVSLPASIHCILNELFRNCSPPVIFTNLNCIFESNLTDYKTKELFTKFVLYITEEKLERRIAYREFDNLEKVNSFVENISRKVYFINIDANNGNKMTAGDIMLFLGVTESEIIHYLKRNFFPKDWVKYPRELWDLYLD